MPSLEAVRAWEERFGGPGARQPGVVVPPRPDDGAWYEWNDARTRRTFLAAALSGVAALVGYALLWLRWGGSRGGTRVVGISCCLLALAGVPGGLVTASNASLFGPDGSPTGVIDVLGVALASGVLGLVGLVALRGAGSRPGEPRGRGQGA
jgi:hypothetical protein